MERQKVLSQLEAANGASPSKGDAKKKVGAGKAANGAGKAANGASPSKGDAKKRAGGGGAFEGGKKKKAGDVGGHKVDAGVGVEAEGGGHGGIAKTVARVEARGKVASPAGGGAGGTKRSMTEAAMHAASKRSRR